MKYLSQRSLPWSPYLLGKSKLTVYHYGCTTTCVAMLSDYFGCYKDPGMIAKNTSNYTKEGLIIWGNLQFDHMRFVEREYRENAGKIAFYARDKDKAVILQVDFGKHWVVVLRKALIGNDYLVLDPWTGTKVWAKAKYHNVTGAAYFSRK
jgi:hypothetical protein